MWTWSQLGYHAKPCALLDVNGFYAKLAAFLDDVVARGFVKPAHREMLVATTPADSVVRDPRGVPGAAKTKWDRGAGG